MYIGSPRTPATSIQYNYVQHMSLLSLHHNEVGPWKYHTRSPQGFCLSWPL